MQVLPLNKPYVESNNNVLQDLKPNNLLIASDGQLKIADFGLARDFADPGYKMTCQVITRYDLLKLTLNIPSESWNHSQMVSPTGTPIRVSVLRHRRRHLVCGLYLRRTHASYPLSSRRERHGPVKNYLPCLGNTYGRRLARTNIH